MPAPAAIYTVCPPMVFPASSVPSPTHLQAVEPPPYPSLQPHTGLPYQATPPINTTFLEPGTPTHAAQFASPTHFFPEADAEQERRLKRMEGTIRALQANETHPNASYGDCSLFPGMRLPSKVKILEFRTYEGTTDPQHHLRHYQGKMLQYWDYEEFVINSFQSEGISSRLVHVAKGRRHSNMGRPFPEIDRPVSVLCRNASDPLGIEHERDGARPKV
ncbi:hypothetical protein CRG98_034321 [Punica granatum]|uniref:Uncharacterized protein n=1 Tax=Punica granatum TaxID=22663 RepID=A0A2I0IMR6_PUNGR|nr:hypothetical protein CRG98_034321 [Punica granatum]